MNMCMAKSVRLHETKETGSLHTVSIPIPGSAGDWTRAITRAFSNGADAILTVAEGSQPEGNALDVISSSLARHGDVVFGGRLLDAVRPDHVIHAGYWWSNSELEWRRESYLEVVPSPIEPSVRPADWLSAAALIIPRQVWEAMDGFDERFGSFLGDVDFCLRARGRGFRCLLLRDARIVTTRAPNTFDVVSRAERLQSTLLLASKHGVPNGLLTMASRQVIAHVAEEFERVDFWADYGADIGLSRRTLWFLGNCVQALRRERLMRAVRQTVVCAWTVAVRQRRVKAA